MNNLCYRQNEMTVAIGMEVYKREVDLMRQLRNAGLCHPNLFERTAVASGKALVKMGQLLHKTALTLIKSNRSASAGAQHN